MSLALADGRVQRDHYQRVWRVTLGQYKDAHNGIILHPVILCLQSAQHALAAPGQHQMISDIEYTALQSTSQGWEGES